MNKGKRIQHCMSIFVALLLHGCSGEHNDAIPAITTITGTAAAGAAIEGTVTALDSSTPQKTFTATTSATGAYTLNVAGGTPPFILTITGTAGGQPATLNSIAAAPGQTVNITPLTDLIVSIAAGQPGGATLVNLCTSADAAEQAQCKTALTAATTGTKLSDAVTAVKNMIAPINTAGIDPLNGALVGGSGSGMDAVLDAILVTPAPAQGAMATVTLIAVPGVNLGTVAMPASAGGAATVTPVTVAAGDISTATDANTVLTEIKACMASFTALYPANMATGTAPTTAQIDPFMDATMSFGAQNTRADMITAFTTPVNNNGLAVPGLMLPVVGLSTRDFSNAATSAAIVKTPPISASPAITGTTAWVKMDAVMLGGGLIDVKFVKNAAYTGCPGGWKFAGYDHVDMHMNARVTKGTFNGTTYTRELPFHVGTAAAVAEGISSIVVSNAGLRSFDPASATGAGVQTNITLVTPSPSTGWPSMTIRWKAGNWESIESCQDMKAGLAQATSGPCFDETVIAPGAVFKYQVYGGYDQDPALNAPPEAGPVLYAFPFQIHAVPLSRAFITANDANLFPKNITATPNGTAALNTAAASFATGAALDNVITFNYTLPTVYGGRMDICGIGVTDAANAVILQAEMNAVGKASSCTFASSGLNSGTLAKPAGAFGGTGSWLYVGSNALGNQVVSSQPY